MQPLITIIVPIYNVEEYLERAIASILAQTYRNLEIILVEDGSPDNCGDICDQYAGKDCRIQVLHKENGGLSDARNAGLEIASGEYVAFLDADDYIERQFIEKLYNACVISGSEVAVCRYEISGFKGNIYENSKEAIAKKGKMGGKPINTADIKIQESQKIETFSRKELLFQMYEEYQIHNTDFIVVWNKLYQKKLWDNIRFPKGRIHEDEATIYKIYDKCGKGAYIQDKLYVYYQAEESITRKQFDEKRMDWFSALEERISFYQMKKENALVLQSYKAYADASIRFYKRFMEETDNPGAFCNQCRRNVKETLQNASKYGRLPCKTKIGYCIFLTIPTLYYKLMKNTIC